MMSNCGRGRREEIVEVGMAGGTGCVKALCFATITAENKASWWWLAGRIGGDGAGHWKSGYGRGWRRIEAGGMQGETRRCKVGCAGVRSRLPLLSDQGKSRWAVSAPRSWRVHPSKRPCTTALIVVITLICTCSHGALFTFTVHLILFSFLVFANIHCQTNYSFIYDLLACLLSFTLTVDIATKILFTHRTLCSLPARVVCFTW